jgi:hypothetical protein
LKNAYLSFIIGSAPVRSVIKQIREFKLTNEMMLRMRLILILTAVLAFYITFEMGDDWYVREYANYDWARHIGY